MKKLLLSLILILLIPSVSFAATKWVSPTGEALWANCGGETPLSGTAACSLTRANANVIAGDIVYMRDGIYNTHLFPGASGTSGNVITYQAHTAETPIIKNTTTTYATYYHGILLRDRRYIKIDGVTVGPESTHQRLLMITFGGSYNEIMNCTFDGGGKAQSIQIWDGVSGHNGIITMAGIAIENETFQIHNQTFTWKTTRSVAGEVTLGTTSAEAAANISTAVGADISGANGVVQVWYNTGASTVGIMLFDRGLIPTEVVFSEASTNMSMTGSGYLSIMGIPCVHNWIHGSTFKNFGQVSSGCDDWGGIQLGVPAYDTHSNNNTFENNIFYAGGHHNLETFTRYNVIRNNYFHHENGSFTAPNPPCPYKGSGAGNDQYGNRNIQIYDGYNSTGKFNLLEGNRFGHSGQPPDDDGGDGFTLTAPKNIVRYNAIFNSQNSGILMKSGSYSYSDNNRIYNNTVYKSGAWYSGTGQWQGRNFRWYGSYARTGNVIKNNIFNTYGGASEWTGGDANIYINNTVINNYCTNAQAGRCSANGNPLFVNTDVSDFFSATLPDLTLQSSSPAINQGTYLTTVHVDDIGSGTELKVVDALYFQDGTWGSSLAGHVADWIAIGTVTNVVQISLINYATNTITLANTISRSDGDSVWLYKKSDGTRVLYNYAPDMGAYEYDDTEADTTAPVMSALLPATQQPCTPGDPNANVTISLTTYDLSNPVTCKFDLSDTTYALMGTTFSTTGGNSHSHGLTGLACDAGHLYYARCIDNLGNVNTVSATFSFNIAPLAGDTTPPTLSSAVLGTDGRTLTMTFNESVKFGAGGNGGFTITPSGTAATVSYSYGDYSTALVYITSRIILSTETLTLSYTQPGNGVEDNAGNDKTTFSNQAVTNNSTQVAVGGLLRTLWHSGVTVGNPYSSGLVPAGINFGVRFGSTVAGVITAIRFYKDVADTGTHIGNIWNSNGLLKGSVTFTGETGSGWQQMSFATPIHINANTLYIASYFCPTGDHTATYEYFASSGVNNSPLYAPQSTSGVGYNGVYSYAGTNTFPNGGSSSGRNFWVDIIFEQRSTVNTTGGSHSISLTGGSHSITW